MARVLAGDRVRAVAATFGVSVASVVKWSQRQRATGSSAARPMGGKRRDAMAAGRDHALARLAGQPSLALRALQAELAAKGVKVSYGALWRFVHAEGPSFKKSVLASETERPKIARGRARWRQHQRRIDPRRLVFIDETPDRVRGRLWVKTNMAPLRGRAARGQRLPGRSPHGHWRTLTFIAALRADRIDAPCVFDGPINGEAFTAYIERFLVPTLPPGDVVRRESSPPDCFLILLTLDNLGSHKGQAARAAVRKAGAHLLFRSRGKPSTGRFSDPSNPYSPDLNPIEQVFAKVKHLLRDAAERRVEPLIQCIAAVLDRFTPQECANYLKNSGYASI